MRTFLLLLSSVFIVQSLHAQSTTSGFEILVTPPTAAAQSLNYAVTAVPLGASSSYVNPALLILDHNSSIDVAYTDWVFDANHFFGGANFIKGKRALSVSVFSSVNDDFIQRDTPGSANGSFAITYLSLSGAFAYDLGIFSVGVTGQFLFEEIYLSQASGYAFNFGIARKFFDERLTLASSLLNTGEMTELNVRATELPQTFRVGMQAELFTFSHPKNPDLPITMSLSGDYIVPLNRSENLGTNFTYRENYIASGLQLLIAETVELSAGYQTGNSVRPVSFGAGVLTEELGFHYAIVPFNTGWGTVHSIGIQYNF